MNINFMEDKMDERTNEINRLRNLADTITYYGEGTADELVNFYASQEPDEWNSLDSHDQNLLRRFVSEII
jgi:hypothetical protein